MYEGQIRSVYGVGSELLTLLVDTHIIRSEPNPTGGFAYEVSHDTLVSPILRSKERRKANEKALMQEQKAKEEQERIRKEQQNAFKRRLRLITLAVAILLVIIFSYETYTTNNDKKELIEANNKLQDALVREEELKKENALLASTSMKQMMQKLENWENKYAAMLDSIKHLDSASSNSSIDTAQMKASLLALKTENQELRKQYRQLLTQTATDRRRIFLRMNELNERLFEKLYVTEYKSNKTWIELKDGIIEDYRKFAKEIK